MSDLRKLEYFLLRYVPNAVREEFVNIGLVMMEAGGDGGGFAAAHFTKDWSRAQCLHPNVDVEMLEALGKDVQQRISDVGKKAVLLHEMMESYSNVIQLSGTQHCVAADPQKELKDLAIALVERPLIELRELVKARRSVGSRRIHLGMEDAFKAEGVWDLLIRDLTASTFTNAADDFTFDFAYPVGNELKVFHAVSLKERLKDAELFTFRVAKIGPKMAKMREVAPIFTAVVEDTFDGENKDVKTVLALMEDEKIRVARLREIPAIAKTAAIDLGV
jgi:hypothetical protein